MAKIVALLLASALAAGCAQSAEPEDSSKVHAAQNPYDDPMSPEWEHLDTGAKRDMAVALKTFPSVRRAFLLKRLDPDGTFHFILDVEFDGEPNTGALNAATAAFNRIAHGNKTLEIYLPTPELQATIIKQAKAQPFYVRP
jgi:hypothetical protein